MFVIFCLWIVVIVLSVRLVVYVRSDGFDKDKFMKRNNQILFFGSLAFLFGLLHQVIGMLEALSIIETAKDISPAMVMGGLRVSFLAPVYGFVLFMISYIVWFVFRNKYRYR